MCGKAADVYLPALKFIPDWFVMNKKLKKLDDVVHSLMMIKIFIIDLWLGVKDIKNVRNLKKK